MSDAPSAAERSPAANDADDALAAEAVAFAAEAAAAEAAADKADAEDNLAAAAGKAPAANKVRRSPKAWVQLYRGFWRPFAQAKWAQNVRLPFHTHPRP